MADVAMAAAPAEGQESEPNPEDGRVNLSRQGDVAIVKQIMAWWKDSADRLKERRTNRVKAHKMYDGDQWEQRDKDIMRSQKRPALTFNLLLSIVAAVEGQEANNRQEMKFYGMGQDDDVTAERWNKLLRWVLDSNEGDFELSRQFKEMLQSGEGWVVPEMDYFDDPEGMLRLVFVDNDEIFDDPYSTHPVGTDARFRLRVKMLTADEGEGMWPGKFEAAIKADALANDVTEETDGRGYPDIYLTPDNPKGVKRYDAKDKTWAVVQAWWWQVEDGWVVLNEQTGLLEEKTDAEFEELKVAREEEQRAVLTQVLRGEAMVGDPAMAPMGPPPPPDAIAAGLAVPQMPVVQMPPPLEAQKRKLKRVYEAFSVYDSLLECGPLKEKLKIFPATPLRGIRRDTKNDWIGIIDPIIDAQKQHNVEQSALVQLVQLMPKSSWMGPKGSFHNKADWEAGIAQPGKMLEYNAQRGKPEPIQQPAIPRHLMELAISRPATMREISGVNVELTGQRQGSDAGVVMEQRAKAAQTVLAPLFENARRTKKVLGKVLLAFMQANLSVGRQVRVLGPKGAELITVSEDMLTGTYDLAVDETTHTVNDRMATLNIMQTTLPTLLDSQVPIPPSIVDMLPVPANVREEWKNMIYWNLGNANVLPPPGWKAGMPIPPPAMPGGPPAPAAPPPAA
jgi:hypothetical protein